MRWLPVGVRLLTAFAMAALLPMVLLLLKHPLADSARWLVGSPSGP